MRHVAFLRGINVGRNKRVSMSDLRTVFAALGHADVETYLQSGNVVFTASGPVDPFRIEEAVRERTGVSSRILVRTLDDLRTVVRANPLPEATADPSRFHCAFLDGDPPAGRVADLTSPGHVPEVVRSGDRVLYIWYREGLHRSKLARELDRRLGVATTARNWNTVTKLAAG